VVTINVTANIYGSIYEFYEVMQHDGEEFNYSPDLINFNDTAAMRLSTNIDTSN
jgi:hypothetical protein